MTRDNTFSFNPTLCLDCKNAVRPWRCPWVDRFAPVEGWTATPTTGGGRTQPFESYLVTDCPKFDRDGFCGGLVEDEEHPIHIGLDRKDVEFLAEAICERAIEDWEELRYGELEKTVCSDASTIKRDKVVSFFYSKWFEALLSSFTLYNPAQIRRFIGVKERNFYRKGGSKGCERSAIH